MKSIGDTKMSKRGKGQKRKVPMLLKDICIQTSESNVGLLYNAFTT